MYNSKIISSIKTGDKVYFFEGVFDAILAEQKGLNAIGILGALSFVPEWVRLFTQFNLYVVPDNDAGGKKFADSVICSFEKVNKYVRVNRLPYGKDYSDFINGVHS